MYEALTLPVRILPSRAITSSPVCQPGLLRRDDLWGDSYCVRDIEGFVCWGCRRGRHHRNSRGQFRYLLPEVYRLYIEKQLTYLASGGHTEGLYRVGGKYIAASSRLRGQHKRQCPSSVADTLLCDSVPRVDGTPPFRTEKASCDYAGIIQREEPSWSLRKLDDHVALWNTMEVT